MAHPERTQITVWARVNHELKSITLTKGDKLKTTRGIGIRGESIPIGTILTVGKEVDFDLAFLLVDSNKATPVVEKTPFDRDNEPKAKPK